MYRRGFIATLGSTAAGVWAGHVFGSHREPGTDRFLLSTNGCGRATGYCLSHKIVTVGEKTHVGWLDSMADEGFVVRVRTLDRSTGVWSPTFTVGEAFDNHGGPALTVDHRGFLHILYYPHQHPFRYRRSTRPNDASEWEDEIRFGEGLTYPTLLCGPDDTLYLTCRNSAVEKGQLELWTKPPQGRWTKQNVLAKVRFSGYSAFSEVLHLDPRELMLHLACRFHENSDRDAYGRLQRIGYMRSPDFGKTWQRSDGTALETPVTAETIETLATGGVNFNRVMNVGDVSVDGNGTPHVIYSVKEGLRSVTTLAVLREPGRWEQKSIASLLPDDRRDMSLANACGLVFAPGGEMTVTAHSQQLAAGDEEWGHASNEVVQLVSSDRGATFQFHQVSPPNPKASHWLANVERPGLFHSRSSEPGLIYTEGPPGPHLKDILSNEVWWVG